MPIQKLVGRISLQSVLGGLGVFLAAKQNGARDSTAAITAIVSAITSAVAVAHGASDGDGNVNIKSDNQS